MSRFTPDDREKTQRKPPIGWLLLLFAPLVGFVSMLYMGREAGRRSWYRNGMIFGVAGWILLALYWAVYKVTRNQDLFFVLAFLYVVRVILGVIWWGGFKKIYAFDHAVTPDTIPGDKAWQITHSFWLLWALLPSLQGLMFLQMGYRTQKKKWIRMGWLFFAVLSVGIPLLTENNISQRLDFRIYDYFRTKKMFAASSFYFHDGFFLGVNVLFSALILMLGLYYRKEYLKEIWPGEAAAKKRYAVLEERIWRMIHSIWMCMCAIPFGSGASLIFAGRRIRQRKWIIAGIILLLVPLLYLCGFRGLQVLVTQGKYNFFSNRLLRFSDTDTNTYYTMLGLYNMFQRVTFNLVPALCFALSCSIRERFLQTTAANYGGFRTQIDRELAGREIERFQEMRAQTMQKEKEAEPQYVDDEPRRTLDFEVADISAEKAAPGRTSGFPQPAVRDADRHASTVPTSDLKRTGNPASAAQDTQASAVPAAVDSAAEAKINLNTCTQEEMMRLPGISVAMAMRAIQHREETGGFATVDDFVDFLGLKPHFAVQVFERATTDMPEPESAAQGAKPDNGHRMPRRHLDF